MMTVSLTMHSAEALAQRAGGPHTPMYSMRTALMDSDLSTHVRPRTVFDAGMMVSISSYI